MGFKTSCFISYPHNAGKSVDAFVNRLKSELEDLFAQYVTDPIVTDHDFPTGANFNKLIARSICQSACLLVVYTPVYQRKTFCLQEYVAMERHQTRRYQVLKKDLSHELGMILPLVYTGEHARVPAWISTKINYKNISDATIADPLAVFKQPNFKRWLVEIAQLVDELYNTFQSSDPCGACETDELPDAQDRDVVARLRIPSIPPESFR